MVPEVCEDLIYRIVILNENFTVTDANVLKQQIKPMSRHILQALTLINFAVHYLCVTGTFD
jgi:hypothetical protein